MATIEYIQKRLTVAERELDLAKHDVSATCSRIASMKFDGVRFNLALVSLQEDVARLTYAKLKTARLVRLRDDCKPEIHVGVGQTS